MDIVERLRNPAVFVDRNEVADEIERLRALLKEQSEGRAPSVARDASEIKTATTTE